jgi:hypothetical protein
LWNSRLGLRGQIERTQSSQPHLTQLVIEYVAPIGYPNATTTERRGAFARGDELGELLWAVWKFLVHIVVGSVLFAAVASAAVLLFNFEGWLGVGKMPWVFPYVLQGVEYGLFGIDVFLYVVFLIKISIEFLRDLWQEGS